VAAKGPGEDGAGGVALRPGVTGQAPKAAEALEWNLPGVRLGYTQGVTQVIGEATYSQWLTALTDESPTSSDSTHVAGPVTRVDKAKPKRLVHAAERGVLLGHLAWGWQLFRSSGYNRERKTQREDTQHTRTMTTVTSLMVRRHASQSGPLSDSRSW
jgi:hypothetical protein